MHKSIFAVFLIGFIFAARASVSDNLLEAIDRTRSVFITYNDELDQAVPFREFRASIKGLKIMAENYDGTCKNDIEKAIQLGYQTTDDYFKATNILFEWCFVSRTVFDFILQMHPILRVGDIKTTTTTIIENGMKALSESLGILDNIKARLTEIHGLLQPMPDTLGRELQQLRLDCQRRISELNEQRKRLNAMLAAVTSLSIFALALGPIGVAIGLSATLASTGIASGIIDGTNQPSEQEKMKITEAYYKSLIQTVKYATANVTTVKDKLEDEITAITAQKGNVQGYQDLSKFFPNPLLDKLETLKATLDEFISRYGGNKISIRIRMTVKLRERRSLNDFEFNMNLQRMIVNDWYHLNMTKKEREIQFWKLKPAQVLGPAVVLNDIDKVVL